MSNFSLAFTFHRADGFAFAMHSYLLLLAVKHDEVFIMITCGSHKV